MADEHKPADKTGANPHALIGPAVAIGAALLAVFLSIRKDKPPPQPDAIVTDAIATPAQAAIFGQEDPVQPVAATPPAEAAAVISADGASVKFADQTLNFSATLPPGPQSDPVLAALRKDAVGYLASKQADARATYEAFKKDGDTPCGFPWEIAIRWVYTAKAGDIVSLFGSSDELTGGAHGALRFDTHIAHATGQQIAFADMLQGGLTPAVVIAICEALKRAKQKQIGAATIFDEPIVCAGADGNVKIERAKLALAPSDQNNTFGGIYAYYEPYEVGSFAEGPYQLTIQQEVFAQDLRAEFKSLFAGAAPPTKP
jgi:hypothetical protein